MPVQLPDHISAGNFVDSIERHVGKYHVGKSDAAITTDIRRAVAKYMRAHKGPQYDATLAEDCVRFALETHHTNQALYRAVTGMVG